MACSTSSFSLQDLHCPQLLGPFLAILVACFGHIAGSDREELHTHNTQVYRPWHGGGVRPGSGPHVRARLFPLSPVGKPPQGWEG
jgi:hypothetical protein